MKRFFYWATTISQVLLLITAFGIQELSLKKMGMMRYVVYINHQWETQYPIATLRYMAIGFLVVLFLSLLLWASMAKGIVHKKVITMLIVGGIITFAFVFFTAAYSTESYRSYYFTSLIWAVVALIQDIKTIAYIKKV